MKIVSSIVALLILGAGAAAHAASGPDVVPAIDQNARPLRAVTNEKTAVLIAEAVLAPIYGDDAVRSERPFHASLSDGVWNVDGTLSCAPACLGGTAHVSIAQRDGRILTIFHGK